MRVGYVLRYYPALTETFVYREIAGLLQRGVEVEIAALGARADGALQDELPEVPVFRAPGGLRRLRELGALSSPEARAIARHGRLRDAARVGWLARLARRRGWHRLHAHFAGEAAEAAWGASQRVGVPLSVTVHAADLFKPRPLLGEVLSAATPLVVCEHHARWLSARYNLSSRVVRCGVDPERYGGATPGRAGPLRVLTVARDVPKKGIADLARAVAAVPGATLDWVGGEGTQVPPSQIPSVLAQAHLFALNARVAPDGDQDGVPVSLMEAMATGLPVVSTAVSGIPELVDDSVGWLVPPQHHEALVSALQEAAARPAERARRGAAGARRVREAWTLRGQVRALMAVWSHR